MRKAVLILTMIAGFIALSQGGLALATVGHLPEYSSRLWAGWLSVACGPLGVLLGWAALRRPGLAAPGIFLVALVGSVAINLFYINTFYLLAALFWLLSSILALVAAFLGDTSPTNRPRLV